MRSIAPLLVLTSVITPPATHAQAFEGWDPLLSTTHYDYWIDLGSFLQWRSTNETPIFVAQVLVRGLDSVSQYLPQGYASSTHSIEVRCSDSIVTVLQTTDFDRTGRTLRTISHDRPRSNRPVTKIEPEAAAELIGTLCQRSRGLGETTHWFEDG